MKLRKLRIIKTWIWLVSENSSHNLSDKKYVSDGEFESIKKIFDLTAGPSDYNAR